MSEELGLRDHILMSEIFKYLRRGQGRTASSIMMEVDGLLRWNQEEVEAELQSMAEDGLVEPFSESRPPPEGSWKSTERGLIEHELVNRRLRRRAPCLCHPQHSDLEGIVLALAASHQSCWHGHVSRAYEGTVAQYLFDHKDELERVFQELEARKHVRRVKAIQLRDAGKHVMLTPDGLREYQDVVAPRLGLKPGLCVLCESPRSPLDGALAKLAFDPRLANILSDRMIEAAGCEGVGAHLAATAMYGSVLEGLMYGLAVRDPKTANQSGAAPHDGGKPVQFRYWEFVDFIQVGVDVGWIPKSVSGYADQLRDSRNLIHARKQFEDGQEVDRHLVRITKEVLSAVVGHVEETTR